MSRAKLSKIKHTFKWTNPLSHSKYRTNLCSTKIPNRLNLLLVLEIIFYLRQSILHISSDFIYVQITWTHYTKCIIQGIRLVGLILLMNSLEIRVFFSYWPSEIYWRSEPKSDGETDRDLPKRYKGLIFPLLQKQLRNLTIEWFFLTWLLANIILK